MSTLVWAFAAGIVAAVNPCGFAVLPGYLTHYLGSSDEAGSRGGAHGLLVGGAVVAGKLTVFAVVAAIFLAGGRAIVRIAPWAGAAIGVVFVLLGIWVLAGRSLRIALPAIRGPRGTGLRSAYLFGLAYGTCSLSCCLPIFLGIFVGIGSGVVGSIAGSAALFGAYALGLASIIVPLFALTGNMRGMVVRRIRSFARFTGPLSGLLLAAAGIVLMIAWVPALFGDRSVGGFTRTILGWQTWAQRIALGAGAGVWALLAVIATAAVLYPVLRDRRAQRLASEPVVDRVAGPAMVPSSSHEETR